MLNVMACAYNSSTWRLWQEGHYRFKVNQEYIARSSLSKDQKEKETKRLDEEIDPQSYNLGIRDQHFNGILYVHILGRKILVEECFPLCTPLPLSACSISSPILE